MTTKRDLMRWLGTKKLKPRPPVLFLRSCPEGVHWLLEMQSSSTIRGQPFLDIANEVMTWRQLPWWRRLWERKRRRDMALIGKVLWYGILFNDAHQYLPGTKKSAGNRIKITTGKELLERLSLEAWKWQPVSRGKCVRDWVDVHKNTIDEQSLEEVATRIQTYRRQPWWQRWWHWREGRYVSELERLRSFLVAYRKVKDSNPINLPPDQGNPLMHNTAEDNEIIKRFQLRGQSFIRALVAYKKNIIQKHKKLNSLIEESAAEYDFCLMSDDTKPQKNILYVSNQSVQTERGCVTYVAYTVITPKGALVKNQLTSLIAPGSSPTIDNLTPLKYKILQIAATNGHTRALLDWQTFVRRHEAEWEQFEQILLQEKSFREEVDCYQSFNQESQGLPNILKTLQHTLNQLFTLHNQQRIDYWLFRLQKDLKETLHVAHPNKCNDAKRLFSYIINPTYEDYPFYLKSDIPEEVDGYKNTCIVVNNEQLYYINLNGVIEQVLIADFKKLLEQLALLNKNNTGVIQLPYQQQREVITLNGGHIQEWLPRERLVSEKQRYMQWIERLSTQVLAVLAETGIEPAEANQIREQFKQWLQGSQWYNNMMNEYIEHCLQGCGEHAIEYYTDVQFEYYKTQLIQTRQALGLLKENAPLPDWFLEQQQRFINQNNRMRKECSIVPYRGTESVEEEWKRILNSYLDPEWKKRVKQMRIMFYLPRRKELIQHHLKWLNKHYHELVLRYHPDHGSGEAGERCVKAVGEWFNVQSEIIKQAVVPGPLDLAIAKAESHDPGLYASIANDYNWYRSQALQEQKLKEAEEWSQQLMQKFQEDEEQYQKEMAPQRAKLRMETDQQLQEIDEQWQETDKQIEALKADKLETDKKLQNQDKKLQNQAKTLQNQAKTFQEQLRAMREEFIKQQKEKQPIENIRRLAGKAEQEENIKEKQKHHQKTKPGKPVKVRLAPVEEASDTEAKEEKQPLLEGAATEQEAQEEQQQPPPSKPNASRFFKPPVPRNIESEYAAAHTPTQSAN